jgi:nucleotide-binding universal stress UspA family protein
MNAEGGSRIVVGVDGSPSSLEALTWAAGQAGLSGATLEAVAVWEYPTGHGLAPTGFEWAPVVDTGEVEKHTRDALEEWVTRTLPDGVGSVQRTVTQGHPAAVLLDAARDAELLVVGSRGHGGFAGMLLGSVSQHLVAHATCPVVVVRHSAH